MINLAIQTSTFLDYRRNRKALSDKTLMAYLELLFAANARVSEICSLRPADINESDHTIKSHDKDSKERIIQIENNELN